AAAILLTSFPLVAQTYSLRNDWSDTSNPNGPWSYLQGTTVLPHQVSICCLSTSFGPDPAFGGAWAPGSQAPGFLPLWAKTIGDRGIDSTAGDVLVHSVDSANGKPVLGEATLQWTSSASQTVNISGCIWYAHSAFNRSNDWSLTLGSTQLAG